METNNQERRQRRLLKNVENGKRNKTGRKSAIWSKDSGTKGEICAGVDGESLYMGSLRFVFERNPLTKISAEPIFNPCFGVKSATILEWISSNGSDPCSYNRGFLSLCINVT